ncbi:nucleoid-associated protein [Pseudomonas sp. OE 28.3]|uniref:nucleoid-associated protein n=1 Tax=unclassified Pseudomonas TaxID=196821 RepID=UPI001C3C9050|nr:nucleoid-associated protein [Pseudomonas sp. OE 28.3]QXI59634.1 nucleoid-associated protein [Pseudomonas sp. OE 28.3]
MTSAENLTDEIVISKNSVIERIIFHIVGPDLNTPTILTEVEDPSTHSDFFVARLIETSKGTHYNFNPASGVKDQINQSLVSPHAFIDCSQILAERFQKLYERDKRLIPGVLMLLQIKSGTDTYAAIIKYDDTKVISYKTTTTKDGKINPILNHILNTFVQDKKALQKSAVIKIKNDTDQLICIDRSGKNGDITEKFKDFLDITRKFTHEVLTERLLEALKATAKTHKDILSQEITSQLSTMAKGAISSIEIFNPTTPNILLNALFGDLHLNEQLQLTFEKELKKQKIQNEIIKIPKGHFPKPSRKTKVTYEGIQVIYTQAHEDSKQIEFDETNGTKTFKVSTLKYVIEDEFHGKI